MRRAALTLLTVAVAGPGGVVSLAPSASRPGAADVLRRLHLRRRHRDGTSPSSARKSIGKANGATLLPGDSLLFRRSCSWTRSTSGVQFSAKWNGTAAAPITIGAYGAGDSPVFLSDARAASQNQVNVEVPGSYQVVEGIHATNVHPYLETPACRRTASRCRWAGTSRSR